MKMGDYIKRMEYELSELRSKHIKLCEFMASSDFQCLISPKQNLMSMQKRVMEQYIEILEIRVYLK